MIRPSEILRSIDPVAMVAAARAFDSPGASAMACTGLAHPTGTWTKHEGIMRATEPGAFDRFRDYEVPVVVRHGEKKKTVVGLARCTGTAIGLQARIILFDTADGREAWQEVRSGKLWGLSPCVSHRERIREVDGVKRAATHTVDAIHELSLTDRPAFPGARIWACDRLAEPESINSDEAITRALADLVEQQAQTLSQQAHFEARRTERRSRAETRRLERRWRAETRAAQRKERIALWGKHEIELASYRRAYWDGCARGASEQELTQIVKAEMQAENRQHEIEERLRMRQRRVLRAGPDQEAVGP